MSMNHGEDLLVGIEVLMLNLNSILITMAAIDYIM